MSPRALVLVFVYLFLADWCASIKHDHMYDTPVTTTTVVMAEVTTENVPDGVCHEDMECWENKP